jgi:type II secretory pathway component GspD/PulD (secretin)
VSDLTDDSGTGIPGRNVSKLSTVVNLDLGKSLVLAGLDSKSESRSQRGLPGLSRIPIVGGLFGSHGRRSEQVKNLLFIVPTVVQAVPAREKSFVEETLRVYESFDGDVDEVTFMPPPAASGSN